MTVKVAINGFGRIGRTILRQLMTVARDRDVQVVTINDIAAPQMCAYLFEYDSVFGPYPGDVTLDGQSLIIDGHRIALTTVPDISGLDYSDIDIVMECTGLARTSQVAKRGLQIGAGAVLISGPSPAAEVTVVMGANDAAMGAAKIVSNASCTTNALAPLLRYLDAEIGIEAGHMTTIHCYTGSQPMIDAPRGDFARSRAGALSMVPTTTGAAHLIGEVMPDMQGRITGSAVRVPVASVSSVDLTVQLARDTGPKELHRLLRAADGVLGHTDKPLVSSDLRARPESLVIALPETQLTGPRLARVFGWYDNEWGFSARMIDMAEAMANRAAR